MNCGIGQKNVKMLSCWLNRHLHPPGFYCTLSHPCQCVKLLMLHCMRSGVAISHIMPNNPEMPAVFASQMLFKEEKDYTESREKEMVGRNWDHIQSCWTSQSELSILAKLSKKHGSLDQNIISSYHIISHIISYHRMAWGEKDHDAHLISNPLLYAGLPISRPDCPEPHPAWPWMPAGMGHPQPPWATCSSVSPPFVWTISSSFQVLVSRF